MSGPSPAMTALAVIIVLAVPMLVRSVRIANEWRRAVVLRFGRFIGVRGPGLYLLAPILDRVAEVIDMRIQTTIITAEQALTRDMVSVGVDAIVFWQVENAEFAMSAMAPSLSPALRRGRIAKRSG